MTTATTPIPALTTAPPLTTSPTPIPAPPSPGPAPSPMPSVPPTLPGATGTAPISPGDASIEATGTTGVVGEVPANDRDKKINGVMLWYAVGAIAYAIAYNKAAQDIKNIPDGNGLFPLDNSADRVVPISAAVINNEKSSATAALKTNIDTVKDIVSEMPVEEATETLESLELE